MKNLTSWNDVMACPCASCAALFEIYNRCLEFSEPAFVCDCRMHVATRAWIIASIDVLFVQSRPNWYRFSTMEDAVACVLRSQRHCDVFLSSFPDMPQNDGDYRWWRQEAPA